MLKLSQVNGTFSYMKRLLTLSLLLITTFCSAQSIVSVEPQDSILGFLLGIALPSQAFPYNVQNYKVTYRTVDVFGDSTTASGLLSVPTDRRNTYPMAVYSHGTVTNREAVPSRVGVPERGLVAGVAAKGMITVAPDYLGLGDNEAVIHPYVHAASEASAGRDLLLAAKQWLDANDISYNNQLFLTGYSQGGHATQALHRDIQLNPGDDNLEVTAATHLSGPYSISDVMRETLFSDELATLPGYIVYTYISYDYVYDLFDDFNEVFTEPYVGIVDSFSNGDYDLNRFNGRLTEELVGRSQGLGDMLQADVRRQLAEKDTSAAVVRAMIDNDTYDWAPEAPTLIVYCTEDEQVPPRNAIIADSVMNRNGATAVTTVNGGAFTHGDCILNSAIPQTLDFFAQYAAITAVSTADLVNLPAFKISPNPVRPGELLQLAGLPDGLTDYAIYDQTGRVLATGRVNAYSTLRLGHELTSGIYSLRVNVGRGKFAIRRFVVR